MSFSPLDHFWLRVTRGQISEYQELHKFGTSASIGGSYVPICRGLNYQVPTTAQALEVVSSDVNDTAAGTGARTLTVIGLNNLWQEVAQTVSMNGTTAVPLPTNLLRMYEFYVETSGVYATQTTPSHVGTITVRGAGGGATWGIISPTTFPRGQSQIGAYTVPKGKTACIYFHYASTESTKSGDIIFFTRKNADIITAPYDAMRAGPEFVGITGFISLGDTASPQGPYVGPCDIGFLGKINVGTGSISIDFEIVLYDTV